MHSTRFSTALLAAVLLQPPLLAAAESPGNESQILPVAERYLAAIQARDWDSMAALLAPEARYLDFSMEHFEVPPVDLRGPEAIVGFWRESSAGAGTLSIRFDLSNRFAAGPNVVLRGYSEVRVLGSAWNLPLEVLETRFPQITHLRVERGKVTHHTDHVDYGAAERQIVDQVERYNRQHGAAASYAVHPVDGTLLDQATTYLRALHRDDWDTLRGRLGPDSSYTNFTAEALSGEIERAEGGRRMLELFRGARARSGTLRLDFEVRESFVAGPNAFLAGDYRVTTRGEPWGLEAGTLSFTIPMIVHLRIVDGIVLEHAESMDYATGFSELGVHRE